MNYNNSNVITYDNKNNNDIACNNHAKMWIGATIKSYNNSNKYYVMIV